MTYEKEAAEYHISGLTTLKLRDKPRLFRNVRIAHHECRLAIQDTSIAPLLIIPQAQLLSIRDFR